MFCNLECSTSTRTLLNNRLCYTMLHLTCNMLLFPMKVAKTYGYGSQACTPFVHIQNSWKLINVKIPLKIVLQSNESWKSIFVGGLVTIPSHGCCLAFFYPHYVLYHIFLCGGCYACDPRFRLLASATSLHSDSWHSNLAILGFLGNHVATLTIYGYAWLWINSYRYHTNQMLSIQSIVPILMVYGMRLPTYFNHVQSFKWKLLQENLLNHGIYPLVNGHSYWKWPSQNREFSIKHAGSFQFAMLVMTREYQPIYQPIMSTICRSHIIIS